MKFHGAECFKAPFATARGRAAGLDQACHHLISLSQFHHNEKSPASPTEACRSVSCRCLHWLRMLPNQKVSTQSNNKNFPALHRVASETSKTRLMAYYRHCSALQSRDYRFNQRYVHKGEIELP